MFQKFVCVSFVWNSTHLPRETALQMDVGHSYLTSNAELTHEVAKIPHKHYKNNAGPILEFRQNSGLYSFVHLSCCLDLRPIWSRDLLPHVPGPCPYVFYLSPRPPPHPRLARQNSLPFFKLKFVFCYLPLLAPSSVLKTLYEWSLAHMTSLLSV